MGNTPSESIITSTKNEIDIDQLLSIGIVTASQSSIQLNMTTMLPSQIRIIPNQTLMLTNLEEDEFRTRRREAQRRRRQRQAERR
ncbi:unnamed protein product [Rotaria sp. Silwood2]|nr:unnamed protein product [Rotaria sp. Silwood2]CAF3073461.1 unnamed protein product [Rotaria sp. Silwood2]CAF3303724.1 unnamed protein product [Rotaria sp. Silwood2]CAF4197100.1 unnamed protein product [Rotaria sp. Silwood2]CAF4392137.1 unnamed protein product [Rotaria sp. Silwood2]